MVCARRCSGRNALLRIMAFVNVAMVAVDTIFVGRMFRCCYDIRASLKTK